MSRWDRDEGVGVTCAYVTRGIAKDGMEALQQLPVSMAEYKESFPHTPKAHPHTSGGQCRRLCCHYMSGAVAGGGTRMREDAKAQPPSVPKPVGQYPVYHCCWTLIKLDPSHFRSSVRTSLLPV